MHQRETFKLDEELVFENQKRILIDTGSDKNIIELTKKSENAYNKYKSLLKEDYIHYFHDKGISKFYKREFVVELFKRKDLIKNKGIFYTLDAPIGRKVNENIPRKLLVIFSCMPPTEHYYSSLCPHRMFPKFFNGIERSLVKNVHTMRIMDLNCSHGSHYINTVNYKTYEKEIQESILKVVSELNINKKDVVLYGGSKGGTASIYHGSALDLKFLSVDPILDLTEYNELHNDQHFLKDIREVNLVKTINESLNYCNSKEKYVIGSSQILFNFEHIDKLDKNKITLFNMTDPMITSHPEVSRNSVPEQLMILNKLLSCYN